MSERAELDAAKRALRQAEEALARALGEKSALERTTEARLAEHAHDIKSALGPAVGYAQILRGGEPDAATREQYLDNILTSTMRAVDLCNSLLGGATTGANDDAPDAPTVVDVGAMIAEVVAQFSVMAEARNVSLTSEIAPDFPAINSIPQHIYRALTNVVTNAIKFTPSGGEITIRAELDVAENAVVLVIRDTGAGIPLERILEILKPGATTVSPAGDAGTGLGLGIVNRLMTELGGALDIDSDPGRGTTVSLKFPKRLHAAA